MKFETTIADTSRLIELDQETGRAQLSAAGAGPGEQSPSSDQARTLPYEFTRIDETRFLLRQGTASYIISNASLGEDGLSLEFMLNGSWKRAAVKDEQALLLARMGFKAGAKSSQGALKAPMPGKVLQLLVEEGQTVELGDPVVILEAMKMENELKAPVSGRLSSIKVEAGASVEKNHVLLEIEPLG